MRRLSGFTLIELAITIAVIALLLSFLIPTLARARFSANELKSVANARSLHTLIDDYSNASADRFPVAEANRFYYSPSGSLGLTIPTWNNRWYWLNVLAVHSGWETLLEVGSSPGLTRQGPEPTTISSYELSDTVCAPASVWSRGVEPPQDVRIQRRSDATFPAQKVLLYDSHLSYLRRPHTYLNEDLLEYTAAAFVDGHVRVIVPANASLPATNSMQPNSSRSNERLHNTADGIRGVDY